MDEFSLLFLAVNPTFHDEDEDETELDVQLRNVAYQLNLQNLMLSAFMHYSRAFLELASGGSDEVDASTSASERLDADASGFGMRAYPANHNRRLSKRSEQSTGSSGGRTGSTAIPKDASSRPRNVKKRTVSCVEPMTIGLRRTQASLTLSTPPSANAASARTTMSRHPSRYRIPMKTPSKKPTKKCPTQSLFLSLFK